MELQATRKIYQQALMAGDHKLVLYRDNDDGKLYDLAWDPNQYSNLFRQPACAALRATLTGRLVRALMERDSRERPRQAYA